MKILVADDEPDVLAFVRFIFVQDNHQVLTAPDGAVALQLFNEQAPDLVILDLSMPHKNGLQVLREIRRQSNTPVIMLTVRSAEDDIVQALQSGADDYIVKGFRPRELRARAEAVMRRTRPMSIATSPASETVTLGGLRLELNTRRVLFGNTPIHLTRIEFDLLYYLMLNHDVVLTPGQIILNVWNFQGDGSEHMVRVNISRLRSKVEPDPSRPIYIITVPGVGYMFSSKGAVLGSPAPIDPSDWENA